MKLPLRAPSSTWRALGTLSDLQACDAPTSHIPHLPNRFKAGLIVKRRVGTLADTNPNSLGAAARRSIALERSAGTPGLTTHCNDGRVSVQAGAILCTGFGEVEAVRDGTSHSETEPFRWMLVEGLARRFILGELL